MTPASWPGLAPYLALALYAGLVLPGRPLFPAALDAAMVLLALLAGHSWGRSAAARAGDRRGDARGERALREQLAGWETLKREHRRRRA